MSPACLYVHHMCAVPDSGQKRAPEHLEIELQALCAVVWVLGPETRSLARVVSA